MSMEDFVSNAPDIVTDKILNRLPIHNAAQTSVVSKQWRRAWLSLSELRFDFQFFEILKNKDGSYDWTECSRIISKILFNHNGHVHLFLLRVPADADLIEDRLNHGPWIPFLSQNGVREIVIVNCGYTVLDISSHIFSCHTIQCLWLKRFNINPPPVDFAGFPNLKNIHLANVHFTDPNVFPRLIENCKMLAKLELKSWTGMYHVIIDAPSLKTLILKGYFESLAFRNIGSLNHISITLSMLPKNYASPETIHAVNLLATSCQLQSIQFDGFMSQFLAAGSIIIRSPSVTFNHLDSLCLRNLNLREYGVFQYLLSMIERCPYIQKLDISFSSVENVGQHVVNLSDNQSINDNRKLDRLRELKMKGMTGSSAELKLVEYLLAASPVLQNLSLKSRINDTESELKMSRALMSFPRASPKVSIVCREKRRYT